MIKTEIGAHHLPALGGQADKSSAARQAALERSLHDLTADGQQLDIDGLKRALLASPVSNETTMVCFIAESAADDLPQKGGVLYVQFYQEGPLFHAYSTSILGGDGDDGACIETSGD